MGRQHQRMDRRRVHQVQKGNREQGKMGKTGRKIICGVPTTLAVKGMMMTYVCVYLFMYACVYVRVYVFV